VTRLFGGLLINTRGRRIQFLAPRKELMVGALTTSVNNIERIAKSLKYRLSLADDSRVVGIARPLYDHFLDLLYGRQGLARVVNGEKAIRIRPAHRYLRADLEAQVVHFLKSAIHGGEIVLEVGANIGFFTVLLARWVGPAGRIYAFEPTPKTRDVLLDHLNLNEVNGRVVVSPVAIGDREGRAFLSMNGTSGANSLTRFSSDDTVEVAVTTIDTFCTENSIAPSLIKIDIEGFEFHALRGAKKTLARHRPAVLLELHPMNWSDIGVSSRELVDLLGELRYRLIPLENQADPLHQYGHVVLQPE
jgi:FkbM family methyltransferase